MEADLVLEQAIEGLLGQKVAFTPIQRGRNSRVYRLSLPDGQSCAAKQYFRHPRDPRDRLATEYQALTFLTTQGVRCVPAPLARDAVRGVALYEFVDGAAVPDATATAADIDTVVEFLIRLKDLCPVAGAAGFLPASEACFCLEQVVENIRTRLDRLSVCQGEGAAAAPFCAYLDENYRPAVEELTNWSRDQYRSCGLDPEAELSPPLRTLSPSDLGFHNTLRRPDGELVFLDFEYFGWDDPAKTVADFLLHPGMTLSRGQRGRFLAQMLARLSRGHELAMRIRVAFAMFALKWCMILLNEFVPEHLERRLFTDPTRRPEEVQLLQLEKAKGMLAAAKSTTGSFPYEEWMA